MTFMAETKTPIKILKALISYTHTNTHRGNVHPPVIHSCAFGRKLKNIWISTTHTQVREHFRMKAEIKVTQKASWTVHVIPVTLRRHAVWWFSVTEILTLSNVMWGTVQGVLKRSRYNLIYPYFFQNIYHINMYGTIYILRLSCSGSCLLI